MNTMINRLPVLTWNKLGLNGEEINVKDITGTPAKNLIPEDIAAARREEFVAGKYPMVCDQAFPSGMGKGMDDLLADAGLQPEYIHVKKGEEATVILRFTEGSGTIASSVRVYLEEDAKLHLVSFQMLPKECTFLNDVGVRLEAGASFKHTELELGAGKVYAGAYYDQQGARSTVESRLGYICSNGMSIDHNHVDVFRGKKTEGLMRFYGVLLDDAEKTSRETLDFRAGSKGAVGDEEEQMLVFGEDSKDRAVPMILGEEEDVSGRHAVNIGRLSADMLYYMGSRGISEDIARQLMVRALIQRVSSHIPDEKLREAASRYVDTLFCTRDDCSGCDQPVL